MGLYDRNYCRYDSYDSRRFGRMPLWSVTIWLIVINVAVFFIDNIVGSRTRYLPIATWGHFSAATTVWGMQWWRLITFQFLHADLSHLAFNMLGLYFFGPIIEGYLGRVRFTVFYLLCGCAGAVTYLALWMAHVLVGNAHVPLVGASAGIFGILIATARLAPDATVMLLFPPIPMKLRTLAWVLMGIAFYTILTHGQNAGGQAAHVGGAALGYVLIERPWVLNLFDRLLGGRRSRVWRDYP